MMNENGFTFSKCIVATGRSDLRCGIDSLCAQIRLKYNKDPLEKDTLFLFCGTKKDRLKGILWTGDRFIMIYIRLAEGRFQWPKNKDEARQISGEEFMRLMEGFTIDPSIGPKHKASPLPTTKQPRSKRKLIGKLDEDTGEIIPTGKSGRKKEVSDEVNPSEVNPITEQIQLLAEKDAVIKELKAENSALRKEKEAILCILRDICEKYQNNQ